MSQIEFFLEQKSLITLPVNFDLQNINFNFNQFSLILLILLFKEKVNKISMNIIKRHKSSDTKHRKYISDKKSTISTRQTNQTLSKSFVKKSRLISSTQNVFRQDIMTQSTPVQVYFNPEFRGKYLRNVVDSYFNSLNPQSQFDRDFILKKNQNPIRLSLRSKMKQWKKKSRIISDLPEMNTGPFIRSSPKKSLFSDLSQQKSLEIINEKNIDKLDEQKSQNDSEENLLSNIDSIQIISSPKIRPFSEQNKKRKNRQFQDSKQKNSVTVSLYFNERGSPRQKLKKQVRRLIYSNKYFEQYAVFEQGRYIKNIRKYLSSEENALFQRQQKINKRKVKVLWRYTKFPSTLQYPKIKSIRQTLLQQFKYGDTELDSYIQIYPKSYYNQLFENKNEQLIDIIKCMTKFIINNKGKILTNSFQLDNLFKIQEKQFYLKNLGSSAIAEQIIIRDKTIRHLYKPTWKQQDQRGKWLIRPQYLAPQVIEAQVNCDHKWMESQSQAVMAAQIWSLGCMIIELLTLIPLTSDIKCRIKSNPSNLRKGFLAIKFKQSHVDFQLLKRKQKGLQVILGKKLEHELRNVNVQKQILTVVKNMLIYEAKNRIKPSQILNILRF